MMELDKRLQEILSDVLSMESHQLKDDMEFRNLDEWDSMAFMFLITRIEESFDIELDNDQIVGMSTVGDLKQILARHGVKLNGGKRS